MAAEKKEDYYNVKPKFCEKTQWYKMAICRNETVLGYLLWIENSSYPNNFCKVDRLDMGKPIAEKLETAKSMCQQIQVMIDEGNIV